MKHQLDKFSKKKSKADRRLSKERKQFLANGPSRIRKIYVKDFDVEEIFDSAW